MYQLFPINKFLLDSLKNDDVNEDQEMNKNSNANATYMIWPERSGVVDDVIGCGCDGTLTNVLRH